jgi:hypothetical protein
MPGPVPYLIVALKDNLAAVRRDPCVFHDLFVQVFAADTVSANRQGPLSSNRGILLLWSKRSAHSTEQPANSQCNSGSRVGLSFDRVAEPGIKRRRGLTGRVRGLPV